MELSSPAATIDSIRAVVREMVKRAPDDGNTLSAQALIALFEGDPLSTLHQRALDASPNDPTLLAARSRQLFFVGADPQVSWQLIQRAARLAPRNVHVLLDAAQSALNLRRTDDALELLARVIAIDRNNARAILLEQMLAAASGDSVAVFERFNALAATGQPVAPAVNMLLLGTAVARDSLIRTSVSPATVRDNAVYATKVLFSQGEAYLVRGDTNSGDVVGCK